MGCGWRLSATAPSVALPSASVQSSAIAPALPYLLHPCSRTHPTRYALICSIQNFYISLITMSIQSAAPAFETEKFQHRILMIDLENCPSQIGHLMDDLKQYAQVVICYAQSGAKIPLDWVIPLTGLVNEKRLKIVRMPTTGKNAADFGIAFWAGSLMTQTGADTHFDILSNDTDLDHVVQLLNSQQRSAERITTQKPNDSLTNTPSNPRNSVQTYCLHLDTHQKNRPVKKETLLNHIKSKFNGSGIDAEKLFEDLCKQGAIKLVDNKISYIQKKISELANSAT
jgi:hypothetical protein